MQGKRVLVRADLNVPMDADLKISDDTRIRAAVPTLKYLVDNGAKVLLTSHLVRPLDRAMLTPCTCLCGTRNPVQPRATRLETAPHFIDTNFGLHFVVCCAGPRCRCSTHVL